VRQENFIDEIDILDALREQSVDLVENDGQWPPSIAIAEIVFGTEGTMIGASPRRLHLSAGPPGRDVEAVMVMMVTSNHVIRPLQRRKGCHIGGMWRAL
jgi:hypothetical protein